jgi:hypothetical protein
MAIDHEIVNRTELLARHVIHIRPFDFVGGNDIGFDHNLSPNEFLNTAEVYSLHDARRCQRVPTKRVRHRRIPATLIAYIEH